MLTHHHFLGKTSTNPLSHRQQINLSSSELQLVSKPTTVYSEQHYQQILFFFFQLVAQMGSKGGFSCQKDIHFSFCIYSVWPHCDGSVCHPGGSHPVLLLLSGSSAVKAFLACSTCSSTISKFITWGCPKWKTFWKSTLRAPGWIFFFVFFFLNTYFLA